MREKYSIVKTGLNEYDIRDQTGITYYVVKSRKAAKALLNKLILDGIYGPACQ